MGGSRAMRASFLGLDVSDTPVTQGRNVVHHVSFTCRGGQGPTLRDILNRGKCRGSEDFQGLAPALLGEEGGGRGTFTRLRLVRVQGPGSCFFTEVYTGRFSPRRVSYPVPGRAVHADHRAASFVERS